MNPRNLPTLDESVLAGLDFFRENRLPALRISGRSFRFVVGSVNAYHTGRLLFAGQPAIFADEGNFRELLKTYRSLIKNKTITEAVIISASGEKDSVWQIDEAKRAGLKTWLLTCNAGSTGAARADQVYVSPKAPEPYSYNYSTYLGLLLARTGADPEKIKKYLSRLRLPRNFSSYHYFSFVLPDAYKPVVDMLKVKDDEMFGPYSSLRAFSEGNARHAKFICPSEKELVISFGPNRYFGLPENRWQIKLPSDADAPLVLSLSYYLAGLIQKSRPPYFQRGLQDYCEKTGPKPYGQKKPFPVIVS